MDALSLGLLVSLGASAPQVPADPTPREGEIVVTGEREQRTIHGRVEEPYPETERTPTGSRIGRKVRSRPFRTIASDSGMPGMMNGAGATEIERFDLFAFVRNRSAKECVAEHPQVEEHIVCGLVKVQRALEVEDAELAAALLEPLARTVGLTAWERYYIGHFGYRVGDALADDPLKERSLAMLVSSGKLDEADRNAAMRALVTLAVRRGDDMTAVARLERLIEAAPDDARSLANLAALHARAGRLDQARSRMAQAVATAHRAGQTPPAEWTDFIGQPQ